MNLKTLLVGDIVRLRYVRRFGTCRVISPETVAEHVCFTSIYALLVGRWVNKYTEQSVNFGVLLQRALLHDLEEAKTGDFPRPYKYSHPGLYAALEETAALACKDVLGELELCADDQDVLFKAWKYAKDGTVEGRILSFADFLSAISFIAQEKLAGNRTMCEHVETCQKYLDKFTEPQFEFMQPLLEQAREFVKEVFA